MDKEKKLIAKEISPFSLSIDKSINPDWDYKTSVTKVSSQFIKWKTVSEEMLRELYLSKMILTNFGKRRSGRIKNGERSWSKYVYECFGDMISKRTIDNYLNRYVDNGLNKPTNLKETKYVEDANKVTLEERKVMDGKIELTFNLPEMNIKYIQIIDEL